MFVQSNRLIDLLPYFKEKLADIYGDREVENIFYLICDATYGIKRFSSDMKTQRLSESELLDMRAVVKRLAKQEPIQHILGEVEFYNCQILVNRHTLIPRPETEELVDLINKENPNGGSLLDMGTGSGCIPIALKKTNANFNCTAIDISQQALDLAAKSAKKNETLVDFQFCDILNDNLDQLPNFDIIVSNPPYVLESDKAEMHANVLHFEPHNALFVANNTPLLFYKRIAELALHKLNAGGKLYFEIHECFGPEIVELLRELNYQNVALIKDMQGKDRMVKAELG